MLNKEKIIQTANSIFGKDNYKINQITDEFLIMLIGFTTLCELNDFKKILPENFICVINPSSGRNYNNLIIYFGPSRETK